MTRPGFACRGFLFQTVFFALAAGFLFAASLCLGKDAFVRVSPRDSRYLELSDGKPFIPIGLNLIAPDARTDDVAGGLKGFDTWLGKLSANGGNFARVWICHPFWDVEHQRSGEYDEAKARRIDAMLAMAARHGIRVKLCIEHFRAVDANYKQTWSQKLLHSTLHGGPATNMDDFYTNARSQEQFKGKLAWLAKRFGNHPAVFGCELWNEINAVTAKDTSYGPWTETMLAELHRQFPKNMAMQSLGSFDTDKVRDVYRRLSLMPGNDVAQVHRYLDPGASLEVCRGPMDILAADAVRELLAFKPGRPVLLAESGAVEARHSGPSKLYEKDKAGVLLHDVLFAPFFVGAAGPGHCWHWSQYVDRNNLWHHFARFAAVVKNLDPPAEDFQPAQVSHPRLRVCLLKGKQTVLAWCRDSKNTWQSELVEGTAPETLTNLKVDLTESLSGAKPKTIRTYDPWLDRWADATMEGNSVVLPAFTRSIVIRAELR